MLIASIIPTAIVGWTSISKTRELLIRDAQELSQERVKQLRTKTENALQTPIGAVLSVGRIPGFFGLSLEEQRSQLATLLNQHHELSVVTLYSANQQRLPGLQGFAVKDVPPTEVAE